MSGWALGNNRSGQQYQLRRWESPGGQYEVLQLLVPHSLRSHVLKLVHGSAGAGNFGVAKTLRQLRGQFYLPGCRHDVELFVHSCDACTTKKGPTRQSHAPLQQYWVGAPFERVGVYILGPFPMTDQGTAMSLWPWTILQNGQRRKRSLTRVPPPLQRS